MENFLKVSNKEESVILRQDITQSRLVSPLQYLSTTEDSETEGQLVKRNDIQTHFASKQPKEQETANDEVFALKQENDQFRRRLRSSRN